jgi:ribonucleoside-diphosphate reductase alpha chain
MPGGERYGNAMDMNVDAMIGSVSERIAPISRQIWDAKYRLKTADGTPVDLTIEDTWRRVARALAAGEIEPACWEQPFYQALQDFRFLPAGRILSGAGTDRRVTLFNCFVMGDIADDLGSIFDHLREAALTMQQGGGIGYDFSSLRPKGAAVKGVGADASGPLSFMDVWDAMCRTIMSAGARRGAMMATMRCDHPDIEDFIAAKRQAGRLRNFNLSVLATDPFMTAVEADTEWPLMFGGKTYKVLRARALFDSITRATTAMPSRVSFLLIRSTPGTTSRIARRSVRPTPAASSHCRPMAPACWARSTWRG